MTDDEIEQIEEIVPSVMTLIEKDQAKLVVLLEGMGLSQVEINQFIAKQEENRSLAKLLLIAGLTAYLTGQLTVDSRGEGIPAGLALGIPPSLIREVLSVAGGGQVAAAADPGGTPLTGLWSGVDATAAISRSDTPFAPIGYVWQYSEEGQQTFPAHKALDNKEFEDWDSPVLAISPANAWLGVSFYSPGDHRGCRCDAVPIYVEKPRSETRGVTV